MDGFINCESCSNYIYDELYDDYQCAVAMDMDEDEMAHFLQGTLCTCPYYQFNDEYVLASKE